MSDKFRFEEEVLNEVVSEYLEPRYNRIKEGELKLNVRDKFSPPYQSIKIDFFGKLKSQDNKHYLILELKQKSDPPNIMMALGEALMYRQMISDEPELIPDYNHNIPIHIGLAFPAFNDLRKKYSKEFKYQSWTEETSKLLHQIIKSLNLESKIHTYLIICEETEQVKSHYEFKDHKHLLHVIPESSFFTSLNSRL